MKWFEPIIIIALVAFVAYVIISNIVKKKKKTGRCECGKSISECTGNCSTCGSGADSKFCSYILTVKGMKCGECEAHINDAIRRNFNVERVKSDRNKCRTIVLSKEPLDETALKKTITDLGYIVE